MVDATADIMIEFNDLLERYEYISFDSYPNLNSSMYCTVAVSSYIVTNYTVFQWRFGPACMPGLTPCHCRDGFHY